MSPFPMRQEQAPPVPVELAERQRMRDIERAQRPFTRSAVRMQGASFVANVAMTNAEVLHTQAAHAVARCPTEALARTAQAITDGYTGFVQLEFVRLSMERS